MEENESSTGTATLAVTSKILSSGQNKDQKGQLHDFSVLLGMDPIIATKADSDWSTYRLGLYSKIISMGLPEEEYIPLLESVATEDDHWAWCSKYFVYDSEEYTWFYYLADEKIQAVCLLYHPKEAVLESGAIFYVEYVAVAPWNRNSLVNTRMFKGIGTTLLREASKHMIGLALKPGFSLHSLPQAESYYVEQGMQKVEGLEKDDLLYFEMDKETFSTWQVK